VEGEAEEEAEAEVEEGAAREEEAEEETTEERRVRQAGELRGRCWEAVRELDCSCNYCRNQRRLMPMPSANQQQQQQQQGDRTRATISWNTNRGQDRRSRQEVNLGRNFEIEEENRLVQEYRTRNKERQVREGGPG
jgi:hypothetical protein